MTAAADRKIGINAINIEPELFLVFSRHRAMLVIIPVLAPKAKKPKPCICDPTKSCTVS